MAKLSMEPHMMEAPRVLHAYYWMTHWLTAHHDVIGNFEHQPPLAVAVLQHIARVQGARPEQGLRLGLELRPVVYVWHGGATAAAAGAADAGGLPAPSVVAPAHGDGVQGFQSGVL